jgi:hypothetical protein
VSELKGSLLPNRLCSMCAGWSTSIVDVRLCAGGAVRVVAEGVVCTQALTQALTDVAAFFPAPLCGAVYPFLLLWVGLSSKVLTWCN